MTGSLNLWKVIEARPVCWNLNRVEVRCETKLGDGSRIKTADGTMPSGWHIAKKLYFKSRGGAFYPLHLSLGGDEMDRTRILRSRVKAGDVYAVVPALEKMVR